MRSRFHGAAAGLIVAAAGARAGSAPGSDAAAPLRVAVYELVAQAGIDPRLAAVTTEALLAEVRKLERVSPLGMSEVQAMLSHEANRQLVGCQADEQCLAEIAGALGVEALIAGTLGRVGDTHLISVKRIDVRAARVAYASTKRMPVADGQEFLSVLDKVTEELFPEYALRAGLTRGVNPEMVKLLNPPPLPAWVFWTTAGAGILMTGIGGTFGLLSAQASADHRALQDRALETGIPANGALLVEKEAASLRHAQTANIVFIAVGAALVSATVEALFTDWYGYRDWRPGSPVKRL